ncbi:metalloendopeptidase [Lactobacillus xylocopicola]|uniref:Peptidase M10 metallopeptidase domain-containing protein n=1 Tax=Lactobacillus xylocopicola TaxID=2976676 RepID=A0ABN6SKY0_9LACO|nr:metalloendopeptidase [Lactobacillus xylocopicola]BDR59912.1 hypothetical protein KIM322_01730 [Lactobacillus xylocopicola]
MKIFRRFSLKLVCAVMAAIALGGSIEPLTNELLVNKPSQVVLAKKKSKKIRWAKPKATVYLDLNHNTDLISATNEAIATWNDTGAFTFKKTKNKKKANIVISPTYSPYSTYAGYTWFNYYIRNHILYFAKVELNTYFLQNFSPYDYSYDRVVNTVEHELGHAIGLKHTKGHSVMYYKGSTYPIQPIDIKHVKKLYHKK